RGLKTARDADGVDGARPWAARIGAKKACERPRLGLEPLGGALGLSQGPAALRLNLPGGGVPLFGHESLALGVRDRLGGVGDGLSARRPIVLVKASQAQRLALALNSCVFRFEARKTPTLLLERGDERPATSGEIGRRGLRLAKRALGAC